MHPLLRTLLAVLVLLCCTLPTVSAGPAPALTRVAPIALWSEATEVVPAEADYPNRLPEGTVFRGENLFIKTRFIGYPAWNLLTYRSGSETGRILDYREVARTPLTDDLRVIVGYEQLVSIPFAEIGTTEIDLCIAAVDAGSGAPRYAFVRGIQTEK
ncbi:hypothetical protein [uncultured Selenomonas sp.]|uniref:hypothetical protein n=1 Tax=uncultured Selenomonas sp. TaxID=159275 RepID=UPI0028DB6B04|nr:hypothetical protein [uncultured Selenomonas sp.]